MADTKFHVIWAVDQYIAVNHDQFKNYKKRNPKATAVFTDDQWGIVWQKMRELNRVSK